MGATLGCLRAGARGHVLRLDDAALRPGHGFLVACFIASVPPPASSSSPTCCGCWLVVAIIWLSRSFVIMLAVVGGSDDMLGAWRAWWLSSRAILARLVILFRGRSKLSHVVTSSLSGLVVA
jgi:hypothetical protein